MANVNHTILKNELYRDPLGFGYEKMNYDEIVDSLNTKMFSEAKLLDSQGLPAFYITGKTGTVSSGLALARVFNVQEAAKEAKTNAADNSEEVSVPMGKMTLTYIKRSRAELLFGADVEVTVEDVRLGYLS